MTEHKLIIKSLRDVSATCTCGGWNFVRPVFDADTDEYIRKRCESEHRIHIRYQTKRNSKAVSK
jgi:hypothetical protein